MGSAIKRADGSYRAWERGGPHLPLLPGETREERDDMPTITNGPVGEGAGIDGRDAPSVAPARARLTEIRRYLVTLAADARSAHQIPDDAVYLAAVASGVNADLVYEIPAAAAPTRQKQRTFFTVQDRTPFDRARSQYIGTIGAWSIYLEQGD